MKRLKYAPETTPAERDRVADALRADGRRSEALLLYEGRPDHPSLKDDLAWALAHGSSFTLLALKRLGFAIGDDEWRACAKGAEEASRWFDALRCYEKVADEASLARVREKLPGYKVAIPENKKE